jgi:hypothetical protein
MVKQVNICIPLNKEKKVYGLFISDLIGMVKAIFEKIIKTLY